MASFKYEVEIFDNAGGLVTTLDPVDLRYEFVMKEPGSIWASFAMSDPNMSTDVFRPKINDFALNLLVDGTPLTLMTGIVDAVNFRSEVGSVEMMGRDYLMWLDQPFAFDAYEDFTTVAALIAGATAEDFTKQWASASGATIEDVVNDLAEPLLAPAYGTNTPAISLAFNGPAFAEEIDWSVYFSDSTSVLDHLRALSDAYDPIGFDFWMEDLTLRLEGPRLIDPSAVTPIYGFYDATTILDIDWTNNGPRTTDVFGFGSGSGNVRSFARKTDADNVAQFRHWRSIVNFNSPANDLTSTNIITNLVDGGEYLEPQKELRLRVRPDFIDGTESADGFINMLGEAVDVDYSMPGYHRIDAQFYVVGQSYSMIDGHNHVLDLTLAQIY